MGTKVLIVDDHLEVLEVLKQFFEMVGIETVTATDGKEGLRQLFVFEPDIVITDLVMPGMDGDEFAKIVRRISDIPIIMLTSISRTKAEEREIKAYDEYLLKPVRLRYLAERIEELTGRGAAGSNVLDSNMSKCKEDEVATLSLEHYRLHPRAISEIARN